MVSFAGMGLPLSFPFLPPQVAAAAAAAAANTSSESQSPLNGSGFASGSGPTDAGVPFPPGIMDSFLVTAGHSSPLLQIVLFVYKQLGTQLGLDPSVVLTMLGFLWGLSKMGSQIWEYLWDMIDRYFMCAMYVSEYDHIYAQLMKWLSLQQSIRSSRYLMAQTVWKSAWEEEEELETALFLTDGDDGDGECKYLNFSNQAARSGPRYVPAMGLTSFWHKGTYFRVHRHKESVVNTTGWGAMKDLEEIKISCFGRSMDPIKQLLADAKMAYYHDTYRKTTIYRPKPKELRRDTSSLWHQVARRPIRPMRTVVLDAREKHGVLADVNEYLHPATPRWYASRGIPLRRGYLFHGPPGTGKTSFSFALAGVFGIDIYVISLQDVNVTEEDLAALFTRLPRRCIVLLEDIDTAGLRRDDDDDKGKKRAEASDKEKLTNGVNGHAGDTSDTDSDADEADDKEEAKDDVEEINGNKKVDEVEVKDEKMEAEEEKEEEKKEDEETKTKKKRSEEDDDKEKKKEKAKGKDKKKAKENGKDKKEAKVKTKAKTKTKGKTAKQKKEKVTKEESESDSGTDSDTCSDDTASDSQDDSTWRKRKTRRRSRKSSDGKAVAESISLSGLLNAIDGVASHEGRVLIMTTNKPEALDEALIRPGRVDVQVGFMNASAGQAEELFFRMYEASRPRAKHGPTVNGTQQEKQKQEQKTASSEKEGSGGAGLTHQDQEDELDVTEAELRDIAQEFGRRIPGGVLSPAEIQGFLLKRKKSPRKALEDVGGWIEATAKQKEAHSKVLTVQ